MGNRVDIQVIVYGLVFIIIINIIGIIVIHIVIYELKLLL